jgi:hypothetical protein
MGRSKKVVVSLSVYKCAVRDNMLELLICSNYGHLVEKKIDNYMILFI